MVHHLNGYEVTQRLIIFKILKCLKKKKKRGSGYFDILYLNLTVLTYDILNCVYMR